MRNVRNLAIATVVVFSSFLSVTANAADPNSLAYYRPLATRADYWNPGYRDGYWARYRYWPGVSNYRGPEFRYGGPYRYGYTSPYFGGDAGLQAKRRLDAEAARNAKPEEPTR